MEILIVIAILIFSAVLHEVAHGFVADKLGDPTARLMGRLTLNPRVHMDPMMSFIVPAMTYIFSGGQFIFGGAKPVPVDPFNLKEGRKDVAIVSLVGPLTNILIAIAASLLLRLVFASGGLNIISEFLYLVIRINVLLAVFNLIPIPPLDGSKVFSLLLPEEAAIRYLAMGNMAIIFFLFLFYTTPIGDFVFNIVSFGTRLLIP